MKGAEMRGKAKLILLSILFAIFIISHAQVMADEGDSSLQKYKWALQFGIKKDLTLGSFEAGDISFKRQMNPKSALRLGVTIRYSYDENSAQHHEYANDISIIYQRYVNPMSRAKFYWGTGPYLHFSYYRSESLSDTLHRKQINKRWGFGIFGLAGVEWFATSVISFHAEYRANALGSWRRDKLEVYYTDNDPYFDERKWNEFDLNISGSVLFGLSVYF